MYQRALVIIMAAADIGRRRRSDARNTRCDTQKLTRTWRHPLSLWFVTSQQIRTQCHLLMLQSRNRLHHHLYYRNLQHNIVDVFSRWRLKQPEFAMPGNSLIKGAQLFGAEPQTTGGLRPKKSRITRSSATAEIARVGGRYIQGHWFWYWSKAHMWLPISE